MGTGELNAGGGNPAMDWHPIQGGVEILLVASCYGNRDKLRLGGPHWPVCRLYLPTKRLTDVPFTNNNNWMNGREMLKQTTAKQTNAQTQVRQPNKQMVENAARRSLLEQQKAV